MTKTDNSNLMESDLHLTNFHGLDIDLLEYLLGNHRWIYSNEIYYTNINDKFCLFYLLLSCLLLGHSGSNVGLLLLRYFGRIV